jgi:Arc/MetJ-type ribon-helix-helix transcriptional regulator
MKIDLTSEQQDFVRQAVASGRFTRPEDAVQAAMDLLISRKPRLIVARAPKSRSMQCVNWPRK